MQNVFGITKQESVLKFRDLPAGTLYCMQGPGLASSIPHDTKPSSDDIYDPMTALPNSAAFGDAQVPKLWENQHDYNDFKEWDYAYFELI